MIPAPYFPLRSETFGVTLGVRPLEAHERLLHIDPERIHYEVSLKREQIRVNRDEYVQLPEATREAQVEAVELLQRDLGRAPELDEIRAQAHPLEWIALQVQEDFCLLDASQPHVPLVGGVVAFPSEWSIREKVGQSFLEVHAPVPSFGKTLGPPSLNLMEKMKFDRPVWRSNWGGLKPTEQLDLTPHASRRVHDLKALVTAENAGDFLYFRVERQTLSKLARTNHILFTIHTYLAPLKEICARRTWLRNLRGWFDTAPEEWLDYKGLAAYVPALRGYFAAAQSGSADSEVDSDY